MHKLSETKLEHSSSSPEEDDLSDYTSNYLQPSKPVYAYIDHAKHQAPLEKQNARAVTPRKAKSAQITSEALPTPTIEVAPVAKQATSKLERALVANQAAPTKEKGTEPGPTLALAPPVAPKIDKEKIVNPKPAAPPLAPKHQTRSCERFNKRVPQPRLGF